MKRILLTALCLITCVFLFGCGEKAGLNGQPAERNTNLNSQEIQFLAPNEGDDIAIISTSMGDIYIKLFAQYAPMATENFSKLAQQGYYNNVSFHRIVKDFIIQSGDASGTGTGGQTIWNNNPYAVELSDMLHHYTGAVAMVRTANDNTQNMSQFYIVQTPQDSVDRASVQTLVGMGMREEVAKAYNEIGGAPYLDNLNTVFGHVYEGMDVVDAIANVKCDENGQPVTSVLIQSITITKYVMPVATEETSPSSDQSSSEEQTADTQQTTEGEQATEP